MIIIFLFLGVVALAAYIQIKNHYDDKNGIYRTPADTTKFTGSEIDDNRCSSIYYGSSTDNVQYDTDTSPDFF